MKHMPVATAIPKIPAATTLSDGSSLRLCLVKVRTILSAFSAAWEWCMNFAAKATKLHELGEGNLPNI